MYLLVQWNDYNIFKKIKIDIRSFFLYFHHDFLVIFNESKGRVKILININIIKNKKSNLAYVTYCLTYLIKTYLN
jgi:hypothetical protein